MILCRRNKTKFTRNITITFLFLLIFTVSCNNSDDKYPYTFYTPKNYDDTDVEKLARYVKDNDTVSIVSFLKENPDVDIDTRDKYFGATLLMFAIFNDQYEAFHCLLEHGADPNFQSFYQNITPLNFACLQIDDDYKHDTRFCRELVEHGADVNKNEPIMDACHRSLEDTKLLVERGADLTVGKRYACSPADEAIIQVKPKIAKYLICEVGVILYQEPRFRSWETEGCEAMEIKKEIEDYLAKHPEQKQIIKLKMRVVPAE